MKGLFFILIVGAVAMKGCKWHPGSVNAPHWLRLDDRSHKLPCPYIAVTQEDYVKLQSGATIDIGLRKTAPDTFEYVADDDDDFHGIFVLLLQAFSSKIVVNASLYSLMTAVLLTLTVVFIGICFTTFTCPRCSTWPIWPPHIQYGSHLLRSVDGAVAVKMICPGCRHKWTAPHPSWGVELPVAEKKHKKSKRQRKNK